VAVVDDMEVTCLGKNESYLLAVNGRNNSYLGCRTTSWLGWTELMFLM
jgi:hypothetical protein